MGNNGERNNRDDGLSLGMSIQARKSGKCMCNKIKYNKG